VKGASARSQSEEMIGSPSPVYFFGEKKANRKKLFKHERRSRKVNRRGSRGKRGISPSLFFAEGRKGKARGPSASVTDALKGGGAKEINRKDLKTTAKEKGGKISTGRNYASRHVGGG